MNNEISNITLTRENYIDAKDAVNRYLSKNEAYKSKKYEVKRLNDEISNNSFLIFKNKNNDSKMEIIRNFEQEIKLLKKQKYVLYLEIRNLVKNMIINNKEYNDIYNKYLEYISSNEEVYSINRPYLDLIKNKEKIDAFFNKLKDNISNNIKISPEDEEKYKKQYKNVMTFLSKVYSAKNNKTDTTNVNNFDLSNELNLNDSYTILSIISIVNTLIINPIYNNHKDSYKEFMQKKNFILEYNNKINELSNKLIKNMSKGMKEN